MPPTLPGCSSWTATDSDIPAEVCLSADRDAIELRWDSGRSIILPASKLRSMCRCADCMVTRASPDIDKVRIAMLSPIGSYGINITFSDGHSRGIFPWTYLIKGEEPGTD